MRIEYECLETGELLTKKMAQQMFIEEYDGDDPTNSMMFSDYFRVVERPVHYVCEFVGGERNRQRIPLAEAEQMTGKRSRDWSMERNCGRLVPRAELDNRPVFQGYLGPMWDGVRYEIDGKLKYEFEVSEFDQIGREPICVLRYETQEVYDTLS